MNELGSPASPGYSPERDERKLIARLWALHDGLRKFEAPYKARGDHNGLWFGASALIVEEAIAELIKHWPPPAAGARREGIEDAAKWHDEREAVFRREHDRCMERWNIEKHPQRVVEALDASKAADRHHEYAAQIRALLSQSVEVGRPSGGEWQPIETAPRDGTHVLLFTTCQGMVEAWFSPGEWSEETPINPREYSGAVWVCADDAFQIEVEETPDGFWDGTATAWQPLPAPPLTAERSEAAPQLLSER